MRGGSPLTFKLLIISFHHVLDDQQLYFETLHIISGQRIVSLDFISLWFTTNEYIDLWIAGHPNVLPMVLRTPMKKMVSSELYLPLPFPTRPFILHYPPSKLPISRRYTESVDLTQKNTESLERWAIRSLFAHRQSKVKIDIP